MKNKIRIDTITDANRFVEKTSRVNGSVVITDGNGLCANAKSLLGALHAMEFTELWCESEEDIYQIIEEFVILE